MPPSATEGPNASSGDVHTVPSSATEHLADPAAHVNEAPVDDDIKIEYHPASKLAPKVFHFEDFDRGRAPEPQAPPSETPWDPFVSRLDFEFARFSLSAALSSQQMDELLGLCRRIAGGEERLSFNNHSDVQNAWDLASNKVTSVRN